MQRKIIFTSQQPTNKLCNEYPFSANKAPMQKKKEKKKKWKYSTTFTQYPKSNLVLEGTVPICFLLCFLNQQKLPS